MAARDTYNASVKTAETNLQFGGATGQANGGLVNNTQQFPSLAAIEAAYAAGQITAAQRANMRNQSAMNAQVQVQTAKDVLRATGDGGPF